MKINQVSVSQLAILHKVTQQAITKAIRAGRIKARKFGHMWIIEAKEANKYGKKKAT